MKKNDLGVKGEKGWRIHESSVAGMFDEALWKFSYFHFVYDSLNMYMFKGRTFLRRWSHDLIRCGCFWEILKSYVKGISLKKCIVSLAKLWVLVVTVVELFTIEDNM